MNMAEPCRGQASVSVTGAEPPPPQCREGGAPQTQGSPRTGAGHRWARLGNPRGPGPGCHLAGWDSWPGAGATLGRSPAARPTLAEEGLVKARAPHHC